MRRLPFAVLVGVALLALAVSGTASAKKSPKPPKPPKPPKAQKTETLQLLAFNDFHGNLEPPTGSAGRIQIGFTPPSTAINVDAGGVEYFSTHMQQLAATAKNNLIVSAGDMIGASPLLSGLFHDEPTIEAMNAIGVDFNGVGNHEFDEGREELVRMQEGGCHPVDGCQDETPFFGSLFQFLAANVVDKDSLEPLFPPYELVNIKGTKIAIIGETLEGTPDIVTPSGIATLSFLDEADVVNALVQKLKKKKVQIFVVLLHEGGTQNGPFADGFAKINGCENMSGPILDIADRMDDEVDVIISGHTHLHYNCTIDGKLVTSASSFGRLITDIDLTFTRPHGDVVTKTAVNKIVTRDVPKDPAMTDLVAHYQVFAAPIANVVIGSITADITRTANLAGESALGDVIADAQLDATDEPDFGSSVVAFMNPGGIRDDLLFAEISGGEAPGEVTFGESFSVQPFGNSLVVQTCTGAQIDTILEQQFDNPVVGERRILQVSDGFTYEYSAGAPTGSKVDALSIKIDGVAVGEATPYRVTMNSFLAPGGDRFFEFANCTDDLGGELDTDALARYFQTHSPVAPGPQNRITRLP